jgi:hypothetical protein
MVDDATLERLLEELAETANGVRAWAASRSTDSSERERLWHRYLMAEERLHARVMELAGEDSD